MRGLHLLLGLALIVGCKRDHDGDGVKKGTDCDDADHYVFPGAVEVPYDGIDNDCDPSTPDDDLDGDGDGVASDCDDADPAINPRAAEICNGVDDNCDGVIDNAPAATWYTDADGDGHGDPATATTSCDGVGGQVAIGDDCDDADAGVHPGAVETCDGVDQDCDGAIDNDAVDAVDWALDGDRDGYGDANNTIHACAGTDGAVADATDCDDADGSVHPDAPESCNGVDDDCDGVIDDHPVDGSAYFVDGDGDGFGDRANLASACAPQAGYADNGDDCDDTRASVMPGGTEVCNGLDDNCDGSIDEDAVDGQTWFVDADQDGFGGGTGIVACLRPAGAVLADGDCDDGDPAISPVAIETCDGIDQNCDGAVDDGAADAPSWYADTDGDGHGDPAVRTNACAKPAGYAADPDDCNDASASYAPGAPESCDSRDTNCDGRVDQPDSVDATTWFADADGDGHGTSGYTARACTAPTGFVASSDDCDDADNTSFPGGTEVCGGGDENCDGTVDESTAVGAMSWHDDADADGFGATATSIVACAAPGKVLDATDCDDTNAKINPNGVEVCGGGDENCNGTVDESAAVDARTWYVDTDGDAYGTNTTTKACAKPSGYAAVSGDCNDGAGAVHPGASEVCNGVDDDCDGTTDGPKATGAAVWYVDADGDSYGSAAATKIDCTAPTGYVASSTDCDDNDKTAHPGAPDNYWDDKDSDCDGLVDEDAWLGNGADGALTVPAGTTNLSTSAIVSYTVQAFTSATKVRVDRSVTGLAAGDEVLLINMHGSDAAKSAVGTWEFRTVASVSADAITVLSGIQEVYGEASNADLTGQTVILQRVPHYTNVTVNNGGTLTTSAWNGTSGGVLALRATGTVSVASGGTATVDARGYKGGGLGGAGCDAYQGESYAGVGDGGVCSGYNQAAGWYNPNYGGGGALITGGGGNYGGGATAGASWNPPSSVAVASGLTYGQADLAVILPGSGGGGVFNNAPNPGPGGNGGGVLYVAATTITAPGAAAFSSNGGTTPYNSQGSFTYGAGGGSGGTVWLIGRTYTLGAGSVRAAGGLGYSAVLRPGGNGGVGRVRIDYGTVNGIGFGYASGLAALATAADPDPGFSTLR